MNFDPFPDSLKDQLVEEVGASLRSLLEEAPDLGLDAVCTWHESCLVLTLDLPKEFPTTAPVASFIRSQKELWHHQIKVNGEPALYARSIVENGRGRLVELTRSILAKRFDDTLGLLENNQNSGIIRLLIIPRYNEAVFAIFQGPELQGFIPLSGAEGWPPVDFSGPPISPTFLMGNLRERKSQFLGLRSR